MYKSPVSKGFTLIETLVAALIMFMVLAVSTQLYHSSVVASQKATASLILSGQFEEARILVKNEILRRHNSDAIAFSGQMGDITYEVEAELIASSTRQKVFNPETGNYDQPKNIYKLWDVKLLLINVNSKRTIRYKELSWP
ncbi:prepilin-type N-terminal cleavage/methylation domain-containing protein [Agarivorans gilvus]|uniref:Prepilin-type N-terminal cleavage/methylation domain-containing protein n=1 Tax=Agarivorans gilvus TaxID=680279 RepID=A0ABQ1HYB1_9ALTE|nr:prepilin-type N-terminal cleavage/methylation domain-containing protein [Agarivorans gilvus]GGA98862.1 hypothetical protein GCM10007414_09860 [Agarivorans gilvus]